MWASVGALLTGLVISTQALRYDPEQVPWNLNTNQTASHPVDYWGQWDGHTYNPSPSNWRFPIYTLFLDRYVNGDPTNGKSQVLGTASTLKLTGFFFKMMRMVPLLNMI